MGGVESSPIKIQHTSNRDTLSSDDALQQIIGVEDILLTVLESSINEFKNNTGVACCSLSSLKEQLNHNIVILSKIEGMKGAQAPLLYDILKMCKEIRSKSLENLGAVCCNDSVSLAQRQVCRDEVVLLMNHVQQLRSLVEATGVSKLDSSSPDSENTFLYGL